LYFSLQTIHFINY